MVPSTQGLMKVLGMEAPALDLKQQIAKIDSLINVLDKDQAENTHMQQGLMHLTKAKIHLEAITQGVRYEDLTPYEKAMGGYGIPKGS